MANKLYNVGELFRLAFGINSPIFITEPLQASQKVNLNFKDVHYIKDYYKKEATSWMGTPIIGLLVFEAGSYFQYNSKGFLEKIALDQMVLPTATLFNFRRAKNITKTNVLGNNGTVKEIYGFDDWVIDVKGLAVDTPFISASEQIEALLKWEKIADSIKISSESGDLFSTKGIFAVVIEEFKVESIQGSPGVIPFTMSLSSDESLELLLNDKNFNL